MFSVGLEIVSSDAMLVNLVCELQLIDSSAMMSVVASGMIDTDGELLSASIVVVNTSSLTVVDSMTVVDSEEEVTLSVSLIIDSVELADSGSIVITGMTIVLSAVVSVVSLEISVNISAICVVVSAECPKNLLLCVVLIVLRFICKGIEVARWT